MIAIIIISILLFLIIWIVVAPITIDVNTEENTYTVYQPLTFKLSPRFTDNNIIIHLRIFMIRFRLFDLSKADFTKMGRKKSDPVKKVKKRKKRFGIKRAGNLIKTFKVKKIDLQLDTDDFVLNSYLLPVFGSIRSQNVKLTINYEGVNSLKLRINSSVGRILLSMNRK